MFIDYSLVIFLFILIPFLLVFWFYRLVYEFYIEFLMVLYYSFFSLVSLCALGSVERLVVRGGAESFSACVFYFY